MPRVLRIINRFNLGGPTYNATYLSAFLSDEFETLLCGGAHESHEGESLFIPEKYGLQPKILNYLQREINLTNDRKALREIRALIREFKPDIVHTHASKAGALGRIAAHKEKVPIIVHTFHGHVFHSYFGKVKTMLYKTVERKLARKTDVIIAISEIQKNELTEIHKITQPEKVKTIPLGFELDRFQENYAEKRLDFRSKYALDQDELAIGIIGRLTAIKNHNLFLEAAKILMDQTTKKVRFFVIGDGELMEPIKNRAKELGLGNVIFTSWIKKIDWALAGLDIVALSSLNEGTPVSLIEAQAAQVPVISTDVGGVRDVVIDGETAFVVKNFESGSFAKPMLDLVENQDLREKMSQNGFNHVKDKFHYLRLCKDVENLYRELLIQKGLR